MATKLVRTYTLGLGKSVRGMGQAVKVFFSTYQGTKVALEYNSDGSCVISCTTESVIKAPGIDKKFKGAVRKFSGNDVQITVTIIPKGNHAEVHYHQDVSEAVQAVKSVFLSFALIGVSQLYGIRARREIPIKLDNAINEYLVK